MPIIKSGKHICSYCKNEFDWIEYELPRTHISSRYFEVETIPDTPKIKKYILADGRILANVSCPNCYHDNEFDIEETVQ